MPKQTLAPKYRLAPGYAYKRPQGGTWKDDSEVVVLPARAEGCEKVYGFITIDGARCAVFATPVGRFAQTLVACGVK